MSENTDLAERLLALLRQTREEELDCERFAALIPAYLDGYICDEQRLALIEHHRRICPECDEEVQILIRALGLEP